MLRVFGGLILLTASPMAMIPGLGRDVETTGLYGAVFTLLQSVVPLRTILVMKRTLKCTFDQNDIRIAEGSLGRRQLF